MFIVHYSRIVAPLTFMLQDSKSGKKCGLYEMSPEARKAFERLKEAFTSAPVLRHFDPNRQIRIETDTSGFAIAGILSQHRDSMGTRKTDAHWHPVAF